MNGADVQPVEVPAGPSGPATVQAVHERLRAGGQGWMLDVASAVVRLEQIDREDTTGHWLWDRVMTCDVPRLRGLLPDDLVAQIDELAGVTVQAPAALPDGPFVWVLTLGPDGNYEDTERSVRAVVGALPEDSRGRNILLAHGYTLQILDDDALADLGLQRIPTPDQEGPASA